MAPSAVLISLCLCLHAAVASATAPDAGAGGALAAGAGGALAAGAHGGHDAGANGGHDAGADAAGATTAAVATPDAGARTAPASYAATPPPPWAKKRPATSLPFSLAVAAAFTYLSILVGPVLGIELVLLYALAGNLLYFLVVFLELNLLASAFTFALAPAATHLTVWTSNGSSALTASTVPAWSAMFVMLALLPELLIAVSFGVLAVGLFAYSSLFPFIVAASLLEFLVRSRLGLALVAAAVLVKVASLSA